MAQSNAMPGVTVVSADDWARIASYGQPTSLGPSETLRETRKSLHDKSVADVNTWDNTVMGQRKIRLAAKSKRAQEREEAQVAIDLEEAKFQAEERRKAIQRCKVKMFKETDMMKEFHGAMVLTETINERGRQTNFKASRQGALDAVEERRRLAMIADVKQAEIDELNKLKHARRDAMAVADHHLQRAADNRAARRKERQGLLEQQDAINEDYVNFLGEERATYSKRRDATIQNQGERWQCDAKAKKLQAHTALLLDVENEKQALYKARADALKDRIKEDTLADRRIATKRREDLAEKLAVIEADHTAEEAARNAAYQAEKFRKDDEAEALKARKRAGAVKEIMAHRGEVMEQKHHVLQSELQADYREREEVEADLQVAAEYEAKLEQERRKRNRTLLVTHGASIAEHTKQVAAAQQELVDERSVLEAQLTREKDGFRNFAIKTMEVAQAMGEDNVVPIIHQINKLDWHAKERPYLPTVDNRRRGNPYPGNSKKRIGMTWSGAD